MTRRIVLLAGMLLGFSAQAQAFEIGINPQVFLTPGWNAAVQQRILDSGAKVIRVGRHGGTSEDQAVVWAGQHGLKVLLFCGYSRGLPITTSSLARQQYADRCLADVIRLDPGGGFITHVEAWNEWNGGLGLGGNAECSASSAHPCHDGALYTDLLRKVFDTFKASRPNIMIVGGAIAGMDLPFLRKMLDAGAHAKMDLLSLHFYSKPKTSCSNALDATAASVVKKFESCVQEVRDVFLARFLTPKQLLFSEWGRVDNGTPERQKLSAETITAMYDAAKHNEAIAGMLWFDLSGAGASKNDGFGLYDQIGGKKPQFNAFKAAAAGAPPLPPPCE